MFSWLFGGSNDKIEAPTERVDEVMEEVYIVKDFYNRLNLFSYIIIIRMTESCIKKCRADSLKPDNQVGENNCMDRCIIKFEEAKEVVEKELQREISNA